MKREVFKEDIEQHKETIEKIKELCYNYKVSKRSGYKNSKLLEELKPYVVSLCVARSIINEKEYAFTYRYIAERIIGWYVGYFQVNVINPLKIRKLFNQSSKIGISELDYKNILIKEIAGYKLISTRQKDYINNIDHLVVLLWSLRDMYDNKYLVSTEEILRITEIKKPVLNKILKRFNIETKRRKCECRE